MAAHRDSVRSSQFGLPTGLRGRLGGWLMRLMNAGMNRAAVEALPAPAGAAILEIGFGPGDAVKRLSSKVGSGSLVAGVDPSAVMVQQARRRNARAVQEGRVDLRQGFAEALPFEDATFDAVLAINTVQFWTDLESGFREVRRVLKAEGTALIAVRTKLPGQRDIAGAGQGEEIAATVREALDRTGFGSVATKLVRTEPFATLLLSAGRT